MPPKSKATAMSAKKGKPVRKTATVSDNETDTDWASDEEPSMRDAIRSLTAMMTSMNARLNQMDGGERKRRKLTTAEPGIGVVATTRAPKQLQASPAPQLTYTTAPLPPPALEHPTPVPMTSAHPLTPQDLGPPPTPLPPLLDVSEAVRTHVAQQMQGASDNFLLADDDSASDEEVSPGKRKRRTIKSGKLCTQDTRVVIRIK